MKQLWPENPKQLPTIGTSSREVTYDDILDLVDRIESLSTLLQNHSIEFEEYKQALQEAITTKTIHADEIHALRAFLQSIESESIVTDEASIETISAIDATLERLESGEGIFDRLTSDSVTSSRTTTDTLNANTISTTDLHTENLSVDRYEIDHVEGNTGSFSSLESENVNADKVEATEVESDEATFTDVTSKTGKIEELESDVITVGEMKHESFQVIEGSEDIYIHLPVLLGKTTYLFKDEDEKKVALQVLNTENNVTVMWSDFAKAPIRYLIDSNFVEMGNYSILILHLKGLEADFELYGFNDYTGEPVLDFVSYSDDWHIPDTRVSAMNYIFGYRNGTKFFRNLDLDKDGGEVHSLTGNFTDVYEDTDDDSFSYDTSETIEKLFYRPDQEVNTDSDVEHHNLHLTGALFDGTNVEKDGKVIGFKGDKASILKTDGTTLEWKKGTNRQILREKEIDNVLSLEYESPVDNTVYPTSLSRDDSIPTQETIANYNGTVTGESPDYPISELRNNTTTHGNHTVENILEVQNKIKEDVYIGEHVFVGNRSDDSKLNTSDYSLVLEEENE